MNTSPRVGITVHYFADGHTTLKPEMEDAIRRAGGTPVQLQTSVSQSELETLFEREVIAGIVIPGGGDHSPELYQGKPELCREVIPERSYFEKAVLEFALFKDLPILGICGGMQLLTVVLGGTLYSDLASERRRVIPHQGTSIRHTVRIIPKTRLRKVVGRQALEVNSTHHQAARTAGRARVAARSQDDNVIEAIELEKARFVVGVQWHPERLAEDRIIPAFVEACGK